MIIPVIEKGIPISRRRAHVLFKWVDYLRSRQVGDSFVESGVNLETIKSVAYRNNINIKVRTVAEGVYRIWRT